jgi:hypothetical protein
MQGAQILRSEEYLQVRRNDEGSSATPQMDFLRRHQLSGKGVSKLNHQSTYLKLLLHLYPQSYAGPASWISSKKTKIKS